MVVPSLEQWIVCNYARELIANGEDSEVLTFLELMDKERMRTLLEKFAENCSTSTSVS